MTYKTVTGFSDYECTETGHIRVKERTVASGKGFRTIPAAAVTYSTRGGRRTKLCITGDSGKQVTTTPQRLVYLAHVGCIPDGYGVVFADGNKQNITASNLKLRRVSAPHLKKKVVAGSKPTFISSMANLLRSKLGMSNAN